MITVKRGLPLVNYFLKIARIRGLRQNDNLVVLTVRFLSDCHTQVKSNGIPYLVLYLKACYVVTQQSLSGYRVSDQRTLKSRFSRNNQGLPRIIPATHRRHLREGNAKLISYWLSQFSLYRVLEYPTKLNLTSIISNSKFDPSWLSGYSSFLPIFQANLYRLTHNTWLKRALKDRTRALNDLFIMSFFPSRSTPVQTKVQSGTMTSLLISQSTWANSPQRPVLLDYVTLTGNVMFKNWLEKGFSLFNDLPGTQSQSKLGFKEEPAGKQRVFAMLDIITQWALKPLHNRIFDILAKIPSDGTFDQIKPLTRLIRKYPNNPRFSFDLSSATDRLPVQVASTLLSSLLGAHFANLWLQQMTSRPFSYKYKESSGEVYYAVGQPMGALSSWSLGQSQTHHSLVQFASYRLGNPKWFDAYCLLGDDIVIADERVAKEYLLIMKELDLEVNLSKSILSPKGLGLEFAKRYYIGQVDASPISIKEILELSILSPALELVRKYNLSLSTFLFLRNFRYRSVSKTNKRVTRLSGRLLSNTQQFKQMIQEFNISEQEDSKLLNTLRRSILESLKSTLDRQEPEVEFLKTHMMIDRTRKWYGLAPYENEEIDPIATIPGYTWNKEQKRFIKGTIEIYFRAHLYDTVIQYREIREDVDNQVGDNLVSQLSTYFSLLDRISLLVFPVRDRTDTKLSTKDPLFLRSIVKALTYKRYASSNSHNRSRS